MKPEDIIVGEKYLFEDQICLGVGMRRIFSCPREFESKHLVIIESENPESVGLMIQEGENADEGTWENIIHLNEKQTPIKIPDSKNKTENHMKLIKFTSNNRPIYIDADRIIAVQEKDGYGDTPFYTCITVECGAETEDFCVQENMTEVTKKLSV